MRPVFESSGDLASLDVLSALCAVGHGGASGEARFMNEGQTVRYGFDQGVLVAVEAPPESSPAEALIRAGKIQRATYEALTVGDFEDRFAVAAASGVISRREAGWGIKIAAIETLARVSGSAEGSYTFAEGSAEPMQPPFRLAVDHWILELFLRSGDRAFVLRKIGATDIPIARVDGFAEGFAALGLTADADAVVEGIDGQRTIEKIVKRSRADEFATLKLLAALMTLGLIHPILETPRSSAAAASEPEGRAPEVPAHEENERPEATLAPFPEEDEPPRHVGELTPEEIERDPEEDATLAFPTREDVQAGVLDAAEPGVADYAIGSFPGDSDDSATPEAAFPPSHSAAIRDDAPVINLPLFALTAPEEPASETILDREETDSPAIADRSRGPRPWMIAAILVAAVIVAIVLVRRPHPATPEAPAPAMAPRTPVSSPEPPRAKTPPKENPRPSSPDIVVSRVPAAQKASPAAPKSEPAAKATGPGQWASLAEAGRRAFEHPGMHRYSIQTELACEDSTLEKALAADPGRRHLWIAPYAFRGRRCYRVLWGKYTDLASARAAKSTLPALFARDGNRPTVVPLGRTPSGGKGRP